MSWSELRESRLNQGAWLDYGLGWIDFGLGMF